MANKENAKQQIKGLLEKYDKVVEEQRLDKYNEAMTKAEFIEPLFEALGWDVRNRTHPDEVTREEKVSKGRVDYGFRIDGIPKFFLEAKPLKANIDNPQFADQAINYAWHKGCTWAVLTDFQCVKIFNAEIKTADLMQSRFFSLDSGQFLERFDQLWLLSRESFEQGLLDKEAEKWGKKSKKSPVGEQLLSDLTKWRAELYKDILNRNKDKNLTEEELEEAVQRVIDRLIFIRNCEDRQLEPISLLSVAREWDTKRKGALFEQITGVFIHFDKEYNSKLFENHLCDKLDVSNQVLEGIIQDLYHTKDRSIKYDFAVLDADVLGNVYEQYLGHILKKTAKRAIVEEKHAYRKEQGIYYTPTYIVGYIVRNTLGELLKDKKVNVEKIRVLDPACGSGSFLIKAFDVLNEFYGKTDRDHQTQLDLETGLPFTKKVKILQDNIFGVDLDARAVEIAQLNLLLKIAEKRQRLPLLQENIKCGNSLIDDDKIAGEKAFKWANKFKQQIEEGGFDVVIGNPPYINAIQLAKSEGKATKQYWKNKYKSAKGAYDIYVIFFEQSLNVCKDGGFVSFITPNKYLSSPYGIALREFIAKNYKLVKVLDLSKVKVFDDPSVYPIVTVIQKVKPKKEYNTIVEKVSSENLEKKTTHAISSKNLTLLPDYIWGIILSENVKLIERIFKKCKPLKTIAEVQATSTASEADEYSRYINEDSKGLPIINTGTIDRYSTTYGITRFMNKGKQLKTPFLDLSKVSETRAKLYKTPKIIISKLALRIEGFFDNGGAYASINTNCIHTPKKGISLDYLAAVINSKLVSFVYSELFSGLKMSGGYFQFQAPQLRVLPIAEASKNEQDEISSLVRRILLLNKRLNEIGDKKTDERQRVEEEIKKTDAEIDELVYKLYGITKSENKIIEESLK